MKKLVFLFALVLAISACNMHEIDEIVSEQQKISDVDPTWLRYPLDTVPAEIDPLLKSASFPTTAYFCVPDKNVYQTSPSSSVTYSDVKYYGGPFVSTTSSISGSTITFTIKRTDGLNFPKGSILKIKLTNAGGATIISKTLTSASTNCILNLIETKTWNVFGTGTTNTNNSALYVATWFNPTSGLTFYTKSIRIVAVPSGWGVNLGSLNNVSIYSNGWGGFSATDYLRDVSYNNSQKFQCVHFIQKYYQIVYNKNIGNTNAIDYWNNYTSHKLTSQVINGSGIPKQGDIICFKSTKGSYHVGIVNGVSGTGKIRIFQENVGQTYVNGNYCSAFKDFNFTTTSKGYDISASALGTSWTTLGWVR